MEPERSSARRSPWAGKVWQVLPLSPRMGREAVALLLLYVAYDAVRGMVGGGALRAQRNGSQILHLEQRLHVDVELALNDGLQRHAALAVAACFIYATLHFVITPLVLAWSYRFPPTSYRRARTSLIAVTAAALIGYWAFPAAPPRLLPSAGFHDTLASFGGWGWWGHSSARNLAGSSPIANEFAAMPSLHMAWAAWCAATVSRATSRPAARWIALGYVVLIALVVLATANHYLLDVLAGLALWFIVDRLTTVVYGPTLSPPPEPAVVPETAAHRK